LSRNRFPIFVLGYAMAGCGASSIDWHREYIQGECHDFVLQQPDGVLTDVAIVHAYWGSWWTTGDGATVRAGRDASWSSLTNGAGFYRTLEEYAPPGGSIVGHFGASVLIGEDGRSPSTQAGLEGELAARIASGDLPRASGGHTPILVVLLAPGASGPPIADGGYLAYHHFMTLGDGTRVPYVVVLFPGGNGLDAVSESHELYETISDPYQRGWIDTFEENHSHAEIGDVCAGQLATVNGVGVQMLWSRYGCACVSPSSG
jgi:hypothetical protein